MSGFAADVIGLVGSAVFIAAFAWSSLAQRVDKLIYNIVNVVGAVLLLISLSVHFNLAATLLESAWGVIALVGVAVEWKRRRGAA